MQRVNIFGFPVKSGVCVVLIGIGGYTVLKNIKECVVQYQNAQRKQKMLKSWSSDKYPKDVVILHQFPASNRMPNASGFALKLETFLRMSKISYIIDTTFPKGESDKSPWITLNGEHFTDSQVIIQMLEKKYGVILGTYSNEEKAVATLARIMIEEHFYWGQILWRYVYSGGSELSTIFPKLSPKELKSFREMCSSKYKTFTWYQGLGRHSEGQVLSFMEQDLRVLSLIVGDRKFLLGNYPCAEDAAVFGIISQALWADVGSPFEKLIKEDLVNLQDYCVRMKETFWPDWEHVLNKP